MNDNNNEEKEKEGLFIPASVVAGRTQREVPFYIPNLDADLQAFLNFQFPYDLDFNPFDFQNAFQNNERVLKVLNQPWGDKYVLFLMYIVQKLTREVQDLQLQIEILKS